jgi:hypothetical protein
MMDDLVITAKHLLDELNVINDGDGRADHPLQADCCQQLHDILNEFIDNNDGDNADSTYRAKMLQLIDVVLSYKPSLRIEDSTGTATLTLKMTDEDTSTKDEKTADVAKEKAHMTDNNDTLTSNQLRKIYGEEVSNKADDLIEGVYVPGLAGGRIAGGSHVATIERNAFCGGKRIGMEYNLALDDQEMHTDLRAVLDKNGGR